jgi:hypothetical protein
VSDCCSKPTQQFVQLFQLEQLIFNEMMMRQWQKKRKKTTPTKTINKNKNKNKERSTSLFIRRPWGRQSNALDISIRVFNVTFNNIQL